MSAALDARIVVAVVCWLLALATSASAGAGWYLMLPPREPDNYYDSKFKGLPLSKWERSTAFDSARECEELLISLRQKKEDELEKARREAKAAVGTREETEKGGIFVSKSNYLEWLKASRCVASDDPGLR